MGIEKNMYEMELSKCEAINCLYRHIGHHGPTVFQGSNRSIPDVHHRLDRDHQTLLNPRTAPRPPVIRNLWLLVGRLTHPVPDQLANDAESDGFHRLLNRSAHVSEAVPILLGYSRRIRPERRQRRHSRCRPGAALAPPTGSRARPPR